MDELDRLRWWEAVALVDTIGGGGATVTLTFEVAAADGADLGGEDDGENVFFSRSGGMSESIGGNDIVEGLRSNPGNIFLGPSTNRRGEGLFAGTGAALDAAFLKTNL
jgi:hypothetical protein